MPDYTDRSYPPIGTDLRYQRGDGAIVTLKIEGGSPAALPDPVTVKVRTAPVVSPAPVQPAVVPELQLIAKPEGRAATVPQPQPAPTLQAPAANQQLLDHPIIGGKFTVFVLLYGPEPFHDLHRRCLESLLATVPAGRMDLRVGSNQLCPSSLKLVADLQEQGFISKHYRHTENDLKYPVMREMFYDESHPIETNWLLWFDDDSICDRDPQWLTYLSQAIIDNFPKNCHMFGAKYVWSILPGQAEWYRQRPWYKGRPFRSQNGKPAPNGNKIIFATGGFWCLSTYAMRACGIPDTALKHNGGDVAFGEQLWQHGFELKAFNGRKQFVNTSSVPRRGYSEKHPGV